MRLRKTNTVELRQVDVQGGDEQNVGLMSTGSGEQTHVNYNVWVDIDGNPCAWTPTNSHVLSVEIRSEGEEDPALDVYTTLKDESRKEKSADERIAELEAMVAKLAAKLASE
jgi:hypothetical protein